MESRGVAAGVLTLMLAAFIFFLTKIWTARSFFVDLKKRGMPMAPHNLLTGHLLILASVMPSFPKDVIKNYIFEVIVRRFGKNGAVYLDLWPFAEPFLILISPHLANQANSPPVALEKPNALRVWTWSLSGGTNLFDAPPEEWKPLRALFSRGFSANHLMNLVPFIVEETQVYCSILREHAKLADLFFLDTTNVKFMLDVIGRTALNVRLNCQVGPNPLADSLLSQISWKLADQELNPLQWLNFVRTLMEWKNGKMMDAYIEKEIEKRFKHYQQKTVNSNEQFESIIDLTLQEYMADPARSSMPKLDKEFIMLARRNIRMLLFVGHDSTGSTITYCHYLLHQYPETLARLRVEHDEVLGKDLTQAVSKLSTDPHLLNQLPYTTAVIKEALRLFPPAASIRQGVEGVDLVDEEGNHYPTGNCMVYILHTAIQRDPANFVRAKEFVPERWLVGPEDPLYPSVKGAWRPFEYGPRNCIGQLQVMVEVKTVLALTVREFDIKPAYDEWDAKNPKKGLRTVDGNRAYQVDEGAAHPADHFPCRVYIRS